MMETQINKRFPKDYKGDNQETLKRTYKIQIMDGSRGIERVLTTFIKTTYDNSLDSQTSLLPLGFSLHALSAEQPAMKENEGNK